MKPKPFWLLNHFTVPLFMGALLLVRVCSRRAITQPVSSRFWGEGRQSGALFAARPSRSAETRSTINGYRTSDSQGVSSPFRGRVLAGRRPEYPSEKGLADTFRSDKAAEKAMLRIKFARGALAAL